MCAHMLWIEMKAETVGQAIARASKTSVASRRERPAPPMSSGTYMAAKPSEAASRSISRGIVPAASHSSAWGAIRSRPKSRAMPKIACCSSLSAKSIWLLPWRIRASQ